MTPTQIIKLIINIATYITLAVLVLFVLSLLGGIVFIAKTALQTLLSPVLWIIGKLSKS